MKSCKIHLCFSRFRQKYYIFMTNGLCLVGTDQASTKNEFDSLTVRPTKRKEPIKVDISVKVVPKPRKVSSYL